MFHLTFNTHICTFCVKMAHLRRINVASVFSGFVILPVFWCITPELWQLLLLLSFHISSSLSTTLEIEIFCCRHFILVPSPRRPVNLPRRWENTTGLAIPFPFWKLALALENTEMHKKQACKAIRSLYWFKNTTGLAIPFLLWKFALALELENMAMHKIEGNTRIVLVFPFKMCSYLKIQGFGRATGVKSLFINSEGMLIRSGQD